MLYDSVIAVYHCWYIKVYGEDNGNGETVPPGENTAKCPQTEAVSFSSWQRMFQQLRVYVKDHKHIQKQTNKQEQIRHECIEWYVKGRILRLINVINTQENDQVEYKSKHPSIHPTNQPTHFLLVCCHGVKEEYTLDKSLV